MPNDLADYLRLTEATLSQWRHKGYGPPYFRVGKHVRYRPDEVLNWLARQETDPNAA
ncbi:helix-turn-helix domain-containing protein [Actinosynnema sp. NPDC020468]|uniref:helix-turn-helix transcriptional regulator n=1 Tax=Actinosynnema sp. NPDC020468 TaxID=3154488 RepID=UPI0033E4E677